MDDADRATETAELETTIALYRSRKEMPKAYPIGRCLYCEEPFGAADSTRRWCDADCRDAWELEHC